MGFIIFLCILCLIGYMETVSDVVKAIDSECYEKVYDAFNCMESLVNGTTCGAYNSTSQIIPGLK